MPDMDKIGQIKPKTAKVGKLFMPEIVQIDQFSAKSGPNRSNVVLKAKIG
jgi:hypothetical protein